MTTLARPELGVELASGTTEEGAEVLEKLARRLTYANVMSTVAVFGVLAGGSAWAASRIGSRDIKNGAVTTKKLKTAAVTTAKLANNAVTAAKLADNAVSTAKLADGAVSTAKLADGAVMTAKLADNAVTSGKVADGSINDAKIEGFSLRLHDLGGQTNDGTRVVGSTTSVPAGGCVLFPLDLFNPAPSGVIGSLVVGYLTDGLGHAVLNNAGAVVPTMVSETSQGGAIPNLMVCAASAQTVPAGSVFHYHLIGP